LVRHVEVKVGDGELSAAADGGAAAASALELVVRPRAVHGHGHGRVATARAAPGLPDHLRLDAPRAFLGGGALALAGRRLLLVGAGLLGAFLIRSSSAMSMSMLCVASVA